MHGTPGSAFPEYEPYVSDLPSCAPVSAHFQLRKDSGGASGGQTKRARAARASAPRVRHQANLELDVALGDGVLELNVTDVSALLRAVELDREDGQLPPAFGLKVSSTMPVCGLSARKNRPWRTQVAASGRGEGV